MSHERLTLFPLTSYPSDSGMSVSFQSGSAGSAGTVSQESSPQQAQAKVGTVHSLAAASRPRKLSAGHQSTNL